MSNNIHIIPSQKIDRAKWDNCINQSSNAMIYACSYYLDAMADNWSGIIVNDYEAVMPVPWRKKLGIKYCYDVPFIQQLGWYCQSGTVDANTLLLQLFSFVKYGDYSFNYHNALQAAGIKQQNNYTIDLSQPHASVVENYTTDAVNNIKKASQVYLSYHTAHWSTALESYQRWYGKRLHNVSAKDYANFNALIKILEEKEQVFARKVMNDSNGNILSIALFLKDKSRIYNIMNSTPEAGRKTGANHYLLDNVFKEFAGSGLVFDFEGSDIPGIKAFYEKFGAENQGYPKLGTFNHLPFPLRLLKR